MSSLPETAGITNHYFRFSPPTRFGAEYQGEVSESERIRCVLGANATGIERNDRREIYCRDSAFTFGQKR